MLLEEPLPFDCGHVVDPDEIEVQVQVRLMVREIVPSQQHKPYLQVNKGNSAQSTRKTNKKPSSESKSAFGGWFDRECCPLMAYLECLREFDEPFFPSK